MPTDIATLVLSKLLPSETLSVPGIIACICGLLFVLYRAIFLPNHPTLESPTTGAKNNRERILTAAFYVPFVPTVCIYWPAFMAIFMTVMVVKGLGEYLQIMKLQTSEEKRKEEELLKEKRANSSRIVSLDRTDR